MTPATIGDRSPARRCSAAPKISLSVVWRTAWPALMLATAFLLPFLNKAYLIDDPHFLAMAQQVVHHPMHPMDFVICWNLGDNCMKAYALTPGNALMGYALAPTVLLGAREWVAHLTQLILVWIAVMAMASLVLRFGWSGGYARAGALLLVALPPFLPMASTAMPDILATTLALAGMERLAAWKAERKWAQGAAAAIALGLAGFARAHLSLLLPLGAFFLLDGMRPREIFQQVRHRFWLWIPILAGGLVLLMVIVTTRERGLLLDPPSVFTGRWHIPRNLVSYLLYLAFPLPLAGCWIAHRLKVSPARLAILLPAAVLVGFVSRKGSYLDTVAVLLAVLGFAALADLLLEACSRWDHEAFFLWLWLLIPLPIVYYGHLPIKYLLPCVPALILVCLRWSESFSPRRARAAAIVLIVAGASYSLLILRTDAEFANFGRSAITELIRPQVAAGRKVWFGGQFSAYWYAPLAGAQLSVAGGIPPRPGDLLVVGLYEGGPVTLKRFPNRTLVQTVSHTYKFGRTMGDGIGLYSNYFGPWLWGLSDPNFGEDRYELWKVTEAPSR